MRDGSGLWAVVMGDRAVGGDVGWGLGVGVGVRGWSCGWGDGAGIWGLVGGGWR